MTCILYILYILRGKSLVSKVITLNLLAGFSMRVLKNLNVRLDLKMTLIFVDSHAILFIFVRLIIFRTFI